MNARLLRKQQKANQGITLNVLDGHFLCESTNTINQEYFLESLAIYIDNNEKLINDIRGNKRRKVQSLVWCGFLQYTQDCIDWEYDNEPFRYVCNSNHLKKWLGGTYDLLQPLVKDYEEEREEYLKELA